jgi:hypothetical protein
VLLEGADQGLGVVGAHMSAAADVEGGCAAGAAGLGAGHVRTHSGRGVVVLEVAQEHLDVEAEPCGVPSEVREVQLVRVGEQEIVHLSEASLGLGRDRGPGGGLRVGVYVDEGQVAEDVAELVAEVLSQLRGDPGAPRAERALVLAVLDQRERGVQGPAHVIHGWVQRPFEDPRNVGVGLTELGGGTEGGPPQE